ncbi:hypothetical protein OROGR_029821 [Orobanche gracilis]
MWGDLRDEVSGVPTDFGQSGPSVVSRLEGPHHLMKIGQGKKEKDESYIERMDEAVLAGSQSATSSPSMLFLGDSTVTRLCLA